MDADTRQLLASSLQAMFAEGGDVTGGLQALGWQDVLDDDESGATTLLFEEQGRALAQSNALDSVVVRAVGLPAMAVLHPVPGAAREPLQADHVDGVLLHRRLSDGAAVAVGAGSALLIENTTSLDACPYSSFDPTLRLTRVSGRVDGEHLPAGSWDAAVTAARRGLSSELLGLGRSSLALAVEQLTIRHQFGRPLGSNQSPRHRLAETHVALAAAENLIEEAWRENDVWTAVAAKAQAGQAAESAARAAMQVCGAMGLTREHPLGGFVRRTFALDGMYGGWRDLSRQLGKRLLDEARAFPEAS